MRKRYRRIIKQNIILVKLLNEIIMFSHQQYKSQMSAIEQGEDSGTPSSTSGMNIKVADAFTHYR